MVQTCKKCVMTSERLGLKFDVDGVCNSCRFFEYAKNINWNKRFHELEVLCDLFRKNDGSYDILIPVSGGKDSHAQLFVFKEELKMHPLCVMIDNGSWTKTGRMNFNNLSKHFGVDIINFTPDRKKMKEETRKAFLEELWPSKYWDSILYEKPLEIAQKFGIGLVAWGENTALTVGEGSEKETPDALKLARPEFRRKYLDLNVIFLSYYIDWSRYKNLKIARENGFKTLQDTGEWEREGMEGFEFEQVDTIGYLVNQYCKFIQFGFGTQTELCSDAIRHGKMTREYAMKQVRKYDWKLDPYMLTDFCEGLDITREEFWKTIDKFANKKLLYKDEDGYWKLKKYYIK